MGRIVPVQLNLRRNSGGITQHRWLVKTSGIRTIEGCGTVHPHADCNRHLAVANALRQPESSGETAVCSDAVIRKLAELPEALAVDEQLIGVIERIGHLQRKGSLCAFHI